MEDIIINNNFRNNSKIKEIKSLQKIDLNLNNLLFPKNPLTNELIQRSIKTTGDRKNQNRIITLPNEKDLSEKFTHLNTYSKKIKYHDSKIFNDSDLKNTVLIQTESFKKIDKNILKIIYNKTNLCQYLKNKYIFNTNTERNKFNSLKTTKIPKLRNNFTSRNKSYNMRDNISNIIKNNKNYFLTLNKEEYKNTIPYNKTYNNYFYKNIYKTSKNNKKKHNSTISSLNLKKLNTKYIQKINMDISNRNQETTLPSEIFSRNRNSHNKIKKYLTLTINPKIDKKYNYNNIFNKDKKIL